MSGYINISNDLFTSDVFDALEPNDRTVLFCLIAYYVRDKGWAKPRFRCSLRRARALCGLGNDAINAALENLRALGYITLHRGKGGYRPSDKVKAEHRGRTNSFTLTFLGELQTNEWSKLRTTKAVARAKSKARMRVFSRQSHPARGNKLLHPARGNMEPDSTFGCDEKPFATREQVHPARGNIGSANHGGAYTASKRRGDAA
jgi:hypothetical protein